MLSNLCEIAMPTEAIFEMARSRYTVFDQCLSPIIPLLNQRLAYGEPMALDR